MSSKTQKLTKQNLTKKLSPSIEPPPDPTAHLKPKQKISYFLNNIEQKIIHQIDHHKQTISSSQSPFFQNQHSKALKKNHQKLKLLTQQRKLTEDKYKQLAQQQFELKHQYKATLKQKYFQTKTSHSHNLSKQDLTKNLINKTERLKNTTLNTSQQNEFLNDLKLPNESNSLKTITSTYKLRPKSQLTSQDIKTLKNLKHQYNRFEEQISLKTIKHNQQLERIRKQNLQFQQMMKKEKNEKKKREIELKLQDLERLKQDRMKKYEEQRVRLMQAKKKPRRFQKLMKQFQNKQKIFEQKKQQEMKLRLKNKILDLTEITQHQKKYQQIRQQQLKQIEQKHLSNSKILKQSRFQPEHKSRFYRSVIEEQKEKKLSQKKKELATIERSQRIKSYAQKVYEEHSPRVKSRENEEEEECRSETKEDRALSVEDRQKLGNNYLREVVKHLKQQQQAKTKSQQGKKSSTSFHATTSKSSNLPPISSLSTKYKDYLTEQRTKQGSPQDYEEIKQKRAKLKYTNSIQQVKKIMSQQFGKKKRYETIDKIKEITENLQHDQNQKNYIQKIRAKLQILQTIT